MGLVERDHEIPSDEERCQANTQSGDRCKRKAQDGSDYCHIHQPDSVQQKVKFDENKKEEFIRHLREGHAHSLSSAAALTGVSRSTPAQHADPDSKYYDPEFAKEYEIAKNEMLGEYEKTMYKTATGEYGDKPYWPALRFALVNLSDHGEWSGEKKNETNVNVSQSQSQEQKKNSVDYQEAREELEDIIEDAIEV